MYSACTSTCRTTRQNLYWSVTLMLILCDRELLIASCCCSGRRRPKTRLWPGQRAQGKRSSWFPAKVSHNTRYKENFAPWTIDSNILFLDLIFIALFEWQLRNIFAMQCEIMNESCHGRCLCMHVLNFMVAYVSEIKFSVHCSDWPGDLILLISHVHWLANDY